MISRFLALTLAFASLVTPVWAGTSNSLLDVSPDGKTLLAANADNSSVTVVDTAAGKALREIKVGDKPEGVTWIATVRWPRLRATGTAKSFSLTP